MNFKMRFLNTRVLPKLLSTYLSFFVQSVETGLTTRCVASVLRRREGEKITLVILALYQRHYRFYDDGAIDAASFSSYRNIMS